MSQINRKYKDKLFRIIFGDEGNKDNLLELYNALNNTHYKDPSVLEITTLEDVLYMGVKQAVEEAADYYCSVPSRFGHILLKNKGEMMDMIFSEFDQEKFAEAMRKEGLEEGREEGEKQLSDLIRCLIADNKNDLIEKILDDKKLKTELMNKYHIN